MLGRVVGFVGIVAAVGLAVVDLRLPFIAAGCTSILLAGYVAAAMPERGFTRPERSPEIRALSTMLGTARQGTSLVKASPVLLLIVVIFLFVGAFEEGFDRLWEAHLLLDVGLPPIGMLGDVAWFGVFGAATLVLSFVAAAPLVTRVERLRSEPLARLLLVLHAAMMLCALGFALSGDLLAAAAAFLATTVVRDLSGPPFQAWLNSSITDSSVRATVLSITSIAGSFGEWTGGPALGAIGTRWGVRAALSVGALLLAPTLLLFARAARQRTSTRRG